MSSMILRERSILLRLEVLAMASADVLVVHIADEAPPRRRRGSCAVRRRLQLLRSSHGPRLASQVLDGRVEIIEVALEHLGHELGRECTLAPDDRPLAPVIARQLTGTLRGLADGRRGIGLAVR